MIKLFKIPVYGQKLIIVTTPQEFIQYVGYEMANATIDGCSVRLPDGVCIIFFNIEKHNGIDLATASHECVHAAWDMLEGIGIPVNTENQEVLAYLQDYMFGNIISWAMKRDIQLRYDG